jgi:hypothetical protein
MVAVGVAAVLGLAALSPPVDGEPGLLTLQWGGAVAVALLIGQLVTAVRFWRAVSAGSKALANPLSARQHGRDGTDGPVARTDIDSID